MAFSEGAIQWKLESTTEQNKKVEKFDWLLTVKNLLSIGNEEAT